MNNTRYEHCSVPLGLTGLAAAAILLVNAAKRADLIPTTAVTQLLAPLAEVCAIGLVIGVYLWSGLRNRSAGWSTGMLVGALAGLVGVEFVINLVFAELTGPQITALRAGPLGVALTVVSVSFLIAVLWWTVAFWRRLPRWALVLFAAGGAVVSLRAFVPEAVLDAGLVTLAIGTLGIALALVREGEHARSLIEGARV